MPQAQKDYFKRREGPGLILHGISIALKSVLGDFYAKGDPVTFCEVWRSRWRTCAVESPAISRLGPH